jgi:hypothetical protein
MRRTLVCAILLVLLLLISGCSSETRSSSPTPLPTTPVPTIPVPISAPAVALTVPDTLSGTPVQPVDPVIGTWTGYGNPGGDRTESVYTFRENFTWTRIDHNLADRTKSNSLGTWKNGGNNQYPILFIKSGSSGTFQYDAAKDELFDPYYQETFHRTPGTGSSPPPVINLTLISEQKVSHREKRHPLSGYLWLIVNITIRNTDEREGYLLDEKGIQVRSDDMKTSYSITSKTEGTLDNPLRFGTIAPGETTEGNVIFAVPEDSRSYALKLVDSRGDETSNVIFFENSTAD